MAIYPRFYLSIFRLFNGPIPTTGKAQGKPRRNMARKEEAERGKHYLRAECVHDGKKRKHKAIKTGETIP